MPETISPDVYIRDVTLRDGVQTLDESVDPNSRITIALHLIAAGVPEIEIGGFGRLPQHQGVEDVIAGIDSNYYDRLSGYTPNVRGVARAAEAGLTRFNLHFATTSGYTLPLLGVDVQNARNKLQDTVIATRSVPGASTTVYLSGVDRAPEGPVDVSLVADATKYALGLGIGRVMASDTSGRATTDSMSMWLEAMLKAAEENAEAIGLHLHDKRGRATGLAVIAASRFGITHFDGSLGGLGKCPADKDGKNGNVATERLVYAFDTAGKTTGINGPLITEAAEAASTLLK